MKKLLKIAALVLAVSIVVMGLASCSNKAVMTLTVDGKTYTITEAEYDLYMKVVKMNFFINNGYTTQYDSIIWSISAGDDQTYGDYYDSYVKNLMETTLVEKYLFDKYQLSLSDETLEGYKSSIATANKNYGGQGAYKREFGYSAKDYFNLYQMAVDKSNAIIEYLYTGENAVDKVTDEDLENYYQSEYSGFQYIYLDMNNKIKTVDVDGVDYYIGLNSSSVEYYVLITVGEDGSVTTEVKGRVDGTEIQDTDDTTITSFQTEELTDDEKTEKSNLPALIKKALDEGGDFKSLMLEYTDDYYGFEYPDGVFISSSGYIVNNDDVMDAARALEVGEYTDAISVSDGSYYYIVKKIPLAEKAYEDEKYETLFSSFDENCMYDKYQKVLDEYLDDIVTDDTEVDKFHIADTFLSDYVDTYYYYSQYYSTST